MVTDTAPAHAADADAPRRGGAMGIWALVLAILGLVGLLPVIGSVLGLVLGWVGLRRADSGAGRRGISLAAVIISIVTLSLLVLGMVAYVIVWVFATRPS